VKRLLRLRRFRIVQFSFFAVVGAINTGVDAGLYWVLTRHAGVEILLASTLSFVAGTVNSFLMNRTLTFGSTSGRLEAVRQYGRFLIASSLVLALHQINLLTLHYGFGLPDLAAKFIGIGAGVVLGFLLNRHWVFRLAPDRV
jgi:putative flippase GtrA